MFLDWVQSSAQNYRLFRYGLEGRDYVVTNESISFPSTTKSLDDLFVNWYGGAAIMNMNLEGPFWMGDSAFNFTNYWKETCRNTEYAPHSGFLPDYTSVNSCLFTRRSTYNETVVKMNMGQYQVKNSEEHIENMKKAGTDELVRTIQQQLDQWRTENMQ